MGLDVLLILFGIAIRLPPETIRCPPAPPRTALTPSDITTGVSGRASTGGVGTPTCREPSTFPVPFPRTQDIGQQSPANGGTILLDVPFTEAESPKSADK